MTDPTNPAHYTSHPSGVQAIDICEHLGFNLGNAIKYVFRYEHKGAPLTDLAKAAWYLRRAREQGYGMPIGVHTQGLIGRVIDAQSTALVGLVLRALFGGQTHFHAAWAIDVTKALALVNDEIAKLESEAA